MSTLNGRQDRAITVMRRDFDTLRGRLFQTVEATGVSKHQEDAIKGLIRHLTYDAQARLEATLRGER
jgi:hypothetical protein